ncbi:MAG: DUF2283 domain-containing protein, partial [Rhizomicrobium sp.]
LGLCAMKVRFDRETDALYVRFSDDAVTETAEVRAGVMLDYSADGKIVAIEILDASQNLATTDPDALNRAVA